MATFYTDPNDNNTSTDNNSNNNDPNPDEDIATLEARIRQKMKDSAVESYAWERDDDVQECTNCKSPFTLLFRRVHCRRCGKIYCRNCCFSKDPLHSSSEKLCVPCVDSEEKAVDDAKEALRFAQWEEAVKKDAAEQQAALEAEEATSRNEGKREEARLRSRFATKLAFLKKEDETRAAEQEKKEEKGTILDRWAAVKPVQARQGALTITVVRAINVAPPSRLLLHCSPFVSVRHNHDEHESEYKYHDACPEFDFETHFVVENDLLPIVITLFDDRGLGVKLFIGNTAVNLRAPYKNLIRNVDDDGIYTERGSVIQSIYGDDGQKVGNCTVECHWKLVLREVEEESFCEICGRVGERCTCSPEDQAKAAEKRNQEICEKEQAVAAERRKRLEAEEEKKKKQEDYEEKKRLRREKAEAAALEQKQQRADKRQRILEEREERRRRRAAGEAVDPSEGDEEPKNDSVAPPPEDLTAQPTLVTEPTTSSPKRDKDGNPIAERTDGEAGKKKDDSCCVVQ